MAPSPEIPDTDRRLAGRRILIAGGGSGIGLATAQLFIGKGAVVSVLDRNVERAAGLAEGCGGVAIEADIADEERVAAIVEKAAAAMNGIDGLVNAAGVLTYVPLEETDRAFWDRVVATNLTGMYLTCRYTLPYLRRETGSTIVNIASSVPLLPSSPGAAYSASKGGVLALTKTLALECAPHVRVNTVCPGMTDTPMTAAATRDEKGDWLPYVRTRYLLQRVGEPMEIAYGVLFMTSRESSYSTGSTLTVDGGRTFH